MKEKPPLEDKVVDVVVNYFNEPKFWGFYSKCEYQIQNFSSLGRADVVLISEKNRIEAKNIGKSPPVLLDVIVECKREGVTGDGPDQLKSYLNVTGTRYGIFANTQAGPSQWEYFENQGRSRFLTITQSEFETALLREVNLIQADGQLVSDSAPKFFINRGANMKIRPTLYVGLGTTGVEILNYLRELNLNEYGQAGLPIFRYVSIETDENNTGKRPHIDGSNRIYGWHENGVPKIQKGLKPKPYEVNDVIHTSIPYTEPIRERIDPYSPVYDEHLAKWLDEGILDSESVKLAGAGAGNLRMAGRLSLWENWNNTVRPKLSQAYHAFLHPDGKNNAEGFLENHFNGTIEVDNQKHNVFIVGTLCGGTCSGMLLDIAYYFRYIGNADTRIYGIFTMYNEGLALGGDSTILLANCYASLVELDYYKRPKTQYQVRFPNGSYIDTDEAPFHIATFLSATNMSNWNCVNSDGLFDRTQLNRMAAKDLFARSLGIDALIEEDLANVPKRDHRFGKIRDGGAFIQYMFSSGVEIAGKEKNSTITSTDKEFTRILRNRWRNSPSATGFDNLEASVSLDNIRGDVSLKDDDVKPEDLELTPDMDLNVAEARVQHYLQPWTPNGKYGNTSKENSDQCRQQFREKLDRKLIDFEGHCQLISKRRLLQTIADRIKESRKELNDAVFCDVVQTAKDAVDNAIKVEETQTGVFRRGKTKSKQIDINQLRLTMRIRQQEYRDVLVDHWASRTLENMLTEIDDLHREVERQITAIERKFQLVLGVDSNFSDENVARTLSQRVIEKEQVEGLIDRLLRSEPDAFLWDVRKMLGESFNGLVPNLSFNKDVHRSSSPYQEFTPNYENYRLRFEQQGGTTRLFRYLLSQNDDEDLRFKTQAEFKEDFAIPHLQLLYQMESGYAISDILVAAQLKQAYDTAQNRYREGTEDPVHIDKASEKFDPDTIKEESLFNQRLEEIQVHWRACRELFRPIVQKIPGYFLHIEYVGNMSQHSGRDKNETLPFGVLAANVLGASGITETFIDNEQGWRELAKATPAFDNFRKQTLEVFRSLRGSHNDPDSLEYLIDRLNEIKKGSEREESVKFYKGYLALLENESVNQA